jgi:phosphatidylglycerophosphatase C
MVLAIHYADNKEHTGVSIQKDEAVKRIAFFDFDGTITTRDTMLELIKYQKGNLRFFAGFLYNMPVFGALKLKLISSQAAKERLLKHFFNGMSLSEFQAACDSVRSGALAEIEKLKKEGYEVTVVSASAENWIKKWTDEINVQLIATRLQTLGDKITGKIDGVNCNHAEKTARIKAAYNLAEYGEIYGYGDSSGDNEMLALATKAFYKPFRN